jgi:hypothetical protein
MRAVCREGTGKIQALRLKDYSEGAMREIAFERGASRVIIDGWSRPACT